MKGSKLFAWFVHLYTASGGLFALLSLIAIDQSNWAQAMAWLLVCFFIDGTDGFLARLGKVWETLPQISGKDIDYVIDFLTYAFIPAYFLYRSGILLPDLGLALAAYVIIISAIYYGRQGMVSEKNQFSGFPVLWNLVVFYCFFVFDLSQTVNSVLVIVFGIMHFLPIEISYPSKNVSQHKGPVMVGFTMLLVLMAILFYYPEKPLVLEILAYLGFAYFIILSIKYTWFSSSEMTKR